MSGFAIYAFVVTGLYIVYMAVIIVTDLFGKKGQKKDDAEEFSTGDLVDDDDDSPAVIDESPDGYSVRQPGDAGTDGGDDDGSPSDDDADIDEDVDASEAEEEDGQAVNGTPDDDQILEQEAVESQSYFDSMQSVSAHMDVAPPRYQDEYLSEDFAVLMAQPINHKSRILRVFVDL